MVQAEIIVCEALELLIGQRYFPQPQGGAPVTGSNPMTVTLIFPW